jgi:hypothetical protein
MNGSTFDKVMDLLGAGGAAVSIIALSNPASGIPAWLAIAATVLAQVTGRAASKGIPLLSSFAPAKKDARGQVADPEDPR